jgi:glycosyltransferase involved in cell wall biosynthesis
MRIFMLVQHPTARGPVPKHTAHLVAALRDLGCDVVTHPWGQRQPGESTLEKLLQRPRDVLSVRRALRHVTFDVAVVKTSHDWRTLLRDIAVAAVIRRCGRPVVLQLHGSEPARLLEPGNHAFKAATRLLAGLIDGLLVLSTEEARQWQSFCPRLPVLPVKNPYVRAFAAPESAVDPGRMLFVGRLIAAKGIFDLVEALRRVLSSDRDCDLVVVGEGAQEQELRDRIRGLDLDGHVVLDGYRTEAELAERFRGAGIFVLPSWSEGFPTVLAEAMDAGLPIVTTRIRGAADHLEPGVHALFVEPRDVEGLTSAITTLLDDSELRTRMANANREHVRVFEPSVVAAEYLEALESIGRATPRTT